MELDRVKESIVQAAHELFRRYGYHKTSVNEIARKAKVAKATIYKYFASKELLLHHIFLTYISSSVNNMIRNSVNEENAAKYLSDLIFKTCRLTYAVCNEYIGWDFIRESTNSQGFLKMFSDDLEKLLISSFFETELVKNDPEYADGLRFLIKSSKSIVFSYAFTSVTDVDVRRNFLMFQKEILPYLIKAAVK